MSGVQKKKKKLGVTNLVPGITRVENCPDFEKLALVIQHGIQEHIVKHIERGSTEANDLSFIF